MNFGWALDMLKRGKAVKRDGWNGSGQFVYYVPGGTYVSQTDVAKTRLGGHARYRPYLALRTSQGDVVTWVPSVSDCLAEDWSESE